MKLLAVLVLHSITCFYVILYSLVGSCYVGGFVIISVDFVLFVCGLNVCVWF
jgi:hypothetical protein